MSTHKEDDKWVGDFNAFVKQASPNFSDQLKAGDEIFTRDDVKSLMLIARKEPFEKAAKLESENAELKKENERLRHRVDVLKAADDQGFEVNERLAAENTRLREALNGIDTYIESAIHNYSPVYKVIKSLINPDKK
jgi:hypothetical protein